MIRVGFVFFNIGSNWLGGVNYFRSLLSALQDLPNRQLELFVFVGTGQIPFSEKELAGCRIVRSALLDGKHPASIARRALRKISGRDFLLYLLLKKHRIDILSHYGSLGKGIGIGSIGWITDFQHRHYPAFFSEQELRARDHAFRAICRDCTTVLLSSAAARSDLAVFDASAVSKAEILHFLPKLDPNVRTEDRLALEQKYGFSGRYFFLPNQFWVHKNHAAVINALAILRERGISAQVIATGNTADYRHREFFDSLQAHIDQAGVRDAFRILGIIPYPDLVGFMHHADAVINPSFFEGWSTTVEEAKALDRPIILSDLEVHREQAPRRGIYFDPQNPAALADIMADVMSGKPGGSDSIPVSADQHAQLRQHFASTYQAIVERTFARQNTDRS